MFEKFTKSARVAVVWAQEEARELDSPRIGVVHVLLGLTFRAEGDFGEVLKNAGLTAESIRASLRAAGRSDPLGEDDAEALRSIGIDLESVRESIAATFGADALDRLPPESRKSRWAGKHIPFAKDAKKVLELALREAIARKDDHIGGEHVLLGILRAPADAQHVIESHIAIPELRTRVEASLDRAA